jgi:hypothetical protein
VAESRNIEINPVSPVVRIALRRQAEREEDGVEEEEGQAGLGLPEVENKVGKPESEPDHGQEGVENEPKELANENESAPSEAAIVPGAAESESDHTSGAMEDEVGDAESERGDVDDVPGSPDPHLDPSGGVLLAAAQTLTLEQFLQLYPEAWFKHRANLERIMLASAISKATTWDGDLHAKNLWIWGVSGVGKSWRGSKAERGWYYQRSVTFGGTGIP